MRFELNIDYPLEKMERSRKRMAAWLKFRYVDRVPVQYCLAPRYFAPLFNLRYLDLFKDVETQYYWELQFAKYRFENISEDVCTGPVIGVGPYFDNVVPPSGHGGEVGWSDDETPRAIPVIHTVEQMERFEIAKPDTGLRGKAIEWWCKMNDLATQTKVTFNGQAGRVNVGLSVGGLSPHMIAVDLVGEDFYWWILEYPEECHRFLHKITQGEIASEEHARRLVGEPLVGDSFVLAEDSAQIMSPRQFKEFCVPYSRALFDRFGRQDRGVHMCGNSTHLHQVLKDDLKMNMFPYFGYLVPPKVAAANLGGFSRLTGNLNPMLMKDGSYQQVKQAARECIEAIGPCGGFMLADGANVCPGTPLQSFQAIMEAAEEYGMGDGKLPRDGLQ
jgi:uroporphyrinogen-III decarboxylase